MFKVHPVEFSSHVLRGDARSPIINKNKTFLESTVISSKKTPVGELDFYNWVTNRPRAIMSATSYKNRAFVLCVKASALQWRKNEEALRKIGDSFSIVA